MTHYSYPILKEITKKYFSQKDHFNSTYILACQHILEPQAEMFELISDFGIPKENINIFGKIYSTSNEVLKELIHKNFKVSRPIFNPLVSFDIKHNENCRKELVTFLSSIHQSSKIIILDDGGELLKVVNENFELIPLDVDVIGIEQTSSGFRKLEYTQLHFPIFNVARSAVKLIKESPFIADLGCRRIINAIQVYSISEPRILVVGLGPIGNSILSILNDKDYFVLGYDIAHQDKVELIDLVINNKINIIVGATGKNILNEKQIQKIKDILNYHLYLVSMSSADREFPTIYIRKNGVSPEEIHGDVIWNNIILINNGFPITFKGNRNESTPEEIEKTIGLLYGSILEAIIKEAKSETGFLEVPVVVNDIIEKY